MADTTVVFIEMKKRSGYTMYTPKQIKKMSDVQRAAFFDKNELVFLNVDGDEVAPSVALKQLK